ncbi:MAG: hypothetical protein F4Z35_04325 [Dehalococcoidia bacterium]|nr:hypothetical protein [Dehalococcoidia bacterium]
MKATCEKIDCGKSAVAQARLGEVAVARACSDHAADLVEFIRQHMEGLGVEMATQPLRNNGKE